MPRCTDCRSPRRGAEFAVVKRHRELLLLPFKGSCCKSGRVPGPVHRVSAEQMKAFGSQHDYEAAIFGLYRWKESCVRESQGNPVTELFEGEQKHTLMSHLVTDDVKECIRELRTAVAQQLQVPRFKVRLCAGETWVKDDVLWMQLGSPLDLTAICVEFQELVPHHDLELVSAVKNNDVLQAEDIRFRSALHAAAGRDAEEAD
eukprot:symbB.v1.2.028106.t1/scaffold2944.1/size66737/1